MTTARLRAPLVLALTLALSGATVSIATDASAQAGSTIKTVSIGSSKRISVPYGKQVRIKLSTASDGGYSWTVTKKPNRAVAKIGKARVVPGSNAGGLVGAPSATYYRISGKGKGRTTIKLVERRSFDHSDVAKRITLTVVVRRR